MGAALHHGHRLSLQLAQHQASPMAGDAGDGKVRDVVKVDGYRLLDRIGQRAQAGSQDDGHLGPQSRGLSDGRSRFVIMLTCRDEVHGYALGCASL